MLLPPSLPVKTRRPFSVAGLTLLVSAVTTLVLAGSSAAWTLNEAQLDNGTCGQNLQLGLDPKLSNSRTPSFVISSDGGLAEYDVFVDNAFVGRFKSDGWGNTCVYTTMPLADGPHRLTGNEVFPQPSLTVIPLDFTVDATPPAPPSSPVLAASTDSGVVGDGITKYKNPRLTGTAGPNLAVQVYKGLALAGGTRADVAGNWSVVTTSMADGTYTMKAATLDDASNKSTLSNGLTITIDATPPAAPAAPSLDPASDTAPLGDNTTATTTPAVTGTAVAGMRTITVFRGGVQVGTATPDAAGGWRFTLPALALGTHLITASATDMAGNISLASTALILTIAAGTAPSPTAPGAPALGSATAGNASVSLAWSAPASNGGAAVTGYRVYRGTTSGGEALLTTVGTGTTWTDTSAVNGTTYYYQVAAVNSVGEGARSNERSATPVAPTSVPSAPSLNAATAGNASVALSWRAPASDGGSPVTGYKIYRGTSSGGATLLATVGVTTAYTDTSAANGTTYHYQLSATNSVGESARSNERSATPVAPATAPGAPTLGSATAGNASVALAWSAPVSNGGSPVTGYKIYRGTTSGGETLLATVGTGTGWTDTSAANGVTYYYQVAAVNSSGEGSRSNERSATPVAPATAPGAPSLTTATAGNATISLSWSAPTSNGGSAITGYRIYRGTSSGGATYLGAVGTSPSWTDTTVTNGATYYYQVTAVNSVGEGARSGERSATPMTVPAAPSLISANPGNSVTLTWAAPGTNGGSAVTGYRIYRGTTSGSATFLTSVGDVTTYTDTTTTNGTTYSYQVSAVTAAGEGARSNELSATPVASGDTTAPSRPGSLRYLVTGTAQIVLDWGNSTDSVGVAGYRVYRNSVLVATAPTSYYTDSGLASGTSYSYTVLAVDAAGNQSPISYPANASTLSVLPGTTGTLGGAVFNAVGAPLSYVTVMVTLPDGTTRSTTTSYSGVWKLSSLPAAAYTVTFSRAGYGTKTLGMSVVAGTMSLATSVLTIP